MKKTISITIAIILTTLSAFANNKTILSELSPFSNNEDITVVNFGIVNKASSPYHIKFISKTNPDEEITYEILPHTEASFNIEKTKTEWSVDNIEIVLKRTTNEQDTNNIGFRILLGILFGGMQGSSNEFEHKQGCVDNTNTSDNANFISNTDSTALSLANTDNIFCYTKNAINWMQYTVAEDKEASAINNDNKKYMKVGILIAEKEDTLTLAIDKNKNNQKITPYFYEITGNEIDSNNPVYLLGTCHSLSPYDYGDEILNRIENTKVLISEFPENKEQFKASQYTLNTLKLTYNKFLEQDLYWFRDQFMAVGLSSYDIENALHLIQREKSKLDDPVFFQTWFSQLSKSEQNKIERISNESGINLSTIHPAILAEFIYLIGETSLENEYVEDSLEVYLIKLFSKNNKEVVYLDTAETLLWTYVNDDFLSMLKKDLETSIKDIKLNIAEWKQTESNAKDCWQTSEYLRAFDINPIFSAHLEDSMHARNLAWQDNVLNALRSGKSASIITGAGHLIGKTGFFKFLKSQGYNIKHASLDQDTQNKLNKVMDIHQWQHDFMESIIAELEQQVQKLE